MTKRETERIARQHQTLVSLGFTPDQADALRRISLTLRRWYEQECGDSTDYASVGLERDEQTGKPYRVVMPHNGGKTRRYPVPDREKGAERRLWTIINARNERAAAPYHANGFNPNAPHVGVRPYLQTDPRGCALYILRPGDVPEGQNVDSYYTRGIAVY